MAGGEAAVGMRSSWRKSVARVVFGVSWGIDAALKWSPAFRADCLGMPRDAAKGQPVWPEP